MSYLDPDRKTIWIEVCDVSSTEACVQFDPPPQIGKRDIERFEISLWSVGSTRSFEELKKVGQNSKFMFRGQINDNLADAYTFHNLKPGTAYKVLVALVFKEKHERMLDYWPELQLPKGELKNIESCPTMFNTAQMPIDQYIQEEVVHARINKREISRKINFVKSERVLYDFAKDHENYELFRKRDGEDDWRKESLKQSIFESRKYKDWKEYARCGYKFAQPSPDKEKRVNRYLLVGNAIDAFEEVPKEPKGEQFLQNDWFQGPFYAWDKNFLQYAPDDYRK